MPALDALPTPKQPALLLVDDDVLIVDALAFSLRRHFEIHTASTRKLAIQLLEGLAKPPQLALIDLGLPPSPHRPDEGFALIKELLARDPDIRVLVLSGQNDEANARHARTLGAIDFVAKPCDPATLLTRLQQAMALDEPDPISRRGLIGDSPALHKLRIQLAQYADSPFPVLIEGESGTGKEIIAHEYLHAATSRAAKPILALNCAAIAPTLVEPTLFGFAKGAFTGASGARAGYFEDVQDGTLFLDEIGELPLDLQAKLLRVLENGEYQRVGETQTRHAAARIVAATNRDLSAEVRAGRFRSDLFHRLSVFTVRAPSLRDMGEDCVLLLEHFRQHFAGLAGKPPFTLSAEALAAWKNYPFPGNVRELRNITVRLTARHAAQTITLAQLADEFDPLPPRPDKNDAGLPAAQEDWQRAAALRLHEDASFELDATLRQMEKGFIDAALEISRGNVSQAARQLGISRTTLYSRMDNQDH